MSGQVDFIVAPASDARAIGRDDDAISKWGGVTWKWLDHGSLHALHGLLDGRISDFPTYCAECRTRTLSPEHERILSELMAEFEPYGFDDVDLYDLPRPLVSLLANLDADSVEAVSAQWHAFPKLAGWSAEEVLQAMQELRQLVQGAVAKGQKVFMRISGLC